MQLPTQAPYARKKLKIVCVTNQKGGCGKSTITVNVSGALAAKGYHVAIMDIDPTSNSTQWIGKRELGDPELLSISIDQLEAVIPKLDAGGLDFLIIDTPGFKHNDIFALLKLADLLIMPSKASYFDLWSTVESLASLSAKEVTTQRMFVLNEVHPTTNIATDAVVALSAAGRLGPTIHYKAGFVNSLKTGSTLAEIDKRNKGAREIAALTDAVLMQLGFHVENPVIIDPLTKEEGKKKVVKQPSKHAKIQLTDEPSDEADKGSAKPSSKQAGK